MKSSHSHSKASSFSSYKSKSSRDRDKRKSQSDNNCREKSSPSKENSRQYAGIGKECINIYKDQVEAGNISDDICTLLAEDINHKLRVIIHDSLLKARLSGRQTILHSDIEETFANFNVNKIYGAPANPVWCFFGNEPLLYLDDKQVSLSIIANEEIIYCQVGTAELQKQWHLQQHIENHKSYKQYFKSICNLLIDGVANRRKALITINANLEVGPIVDWFYNFAYLLLRKDGDCSTVTALELISVLISGPVTSMRITNNQLFLLTRLILQRLLITKNKVEIEIVKQMCIALSSICQIPAIKEFVVLKVLIKIPSVSKDKLFAALAIINVLGVEGVEHIFIPYLDLFFDLKHNTEHLQAMLSIYKIFCRSELYFPEVHVRFYERFSDSIFIIFWKPIVYELTEIEKQEMTYQRSKTYGRAHKRLNYDITNNPSKSNLTVNDVFELPSADFTIKRHNEITILLKDDLHLKELFKNRRKNSIDDMFEITSNDCPFKMEVCEFLMNKEFERIKPSGIIVGKNKKCKYTTNSCNYSLLAYNL